MEFNAKKVKDNIIHEMRNWFDLNGHNCNAIVGISGGVDSSVVTALCVEALGRERVIGVLMPCGEQKDINYSIGLCGYLNIKFGVYNIEKEVNLNIRKTREFLESIDRGSVVSNQTKINAPARIRLKTLRSISQSMNGRVMNTCNLSEDWVGYNTIDGDNRGDFAPLAHLTKTEVKVVGNELGLLDSFINKTPLDGLCGQTDEDRFGFTYGVLDKYIRTGECEDPIVKDKIDRLHKDNLFKMKPMDVFEYCPEDRSEELYEFLTMGAREYVYTNEFKELVDRL